jgi:hypothetical protein
MCHTVRYGGQMEMSKKEDKQKFIAYCGLYCRECPWYTGKVADMTRDLRKELRDIKFEKLAEFIADYPQFAVFKNFPQCYEVLGALMKARCKKPCQESGGPLSCKIRKCCQKREINGCWECAEMERCEKLDLLTPGHGNAHIRNLRLIKRKGADNFIAGKKYWFTVI